MFICLVILGMQVLEPICLQELVCPQGLFHSVRTNKYVLGIFFVLRKNSCQCLEVSGRNSFW